MKKEGFGQNSQHTGDVCPETITLGGLARPPFHDARAEKAEVCLVRCGASIRGWPLRAAAPQGAVWARAPRERDGEGDV